MFKGLVTDIRTDFSHSSTLISIIQHAPDYFQNKVQELDQIKEGLLK